MIGYQPPFAAAADARGVPVRALSRTFGGRFQSTQVLKRTAGATTFRGIDVATTTSVVIKAVQTRALSPAVRGRLEYEIAALEHLVAFRGATALQVGGDDEELFLVRPFVEGVTLGERLRKGALAVRDAVGVASEVLSLLQQAHAAGVVHRDVKPTNIVIAAHGATRAQLIDFGFARHDSPRSLEEQPIEQARYLAPEQSGLLRCGVDGRADLYALGLVLFEALARRSPFSAGELRELLRQHLTVRPPPLRAVVDGIPRALEGIIERLLRKDPRDRYQTAEGALADFEALAAALDRGLAEPEVVIGGRDRRDVLTEPAFVGRTEELATLEQLVDEARVGHGGLVLLEGESGSGKTWLLQELARRGAREAWVLSGEGLDRAAAQPFEVMVGVAREVRAACAEDPARRDALATRLGRLAGTVATALPALTDVVGAVAGPPLADTAPVPEQRTLAALEALLEGLGVPGRPALVLIDDGQWIDPATLRLLEFWAERGVGQRRHVLVVLSFRAEDVPGPHPLRALPSLAHLRLGPLRADDVRQQVASMAGALPEPAVSAVFEHAGGLPLLVVAVLHGMVECGALAPGLAGWDFDAGALRGLQVGGRLADLFAARLTRLSGEARQLLAAGAVFGRTFDPALAGALVDVPPADAIRMVEPCRGPLVWANGDGTYSFLHDRIRAALLESLSPGEARRLHRLAAERLEADDPTQVFDLAFHFDAAEESARALPYALAAADSAREQHDLDLAERLYRVALRGGAAGCAATRYRIAFGLGEVLAFRNRHEEASTQFAEARQLAVDARSRARVEHRAGEIELRRGAPKAAALRAEDALRLLGRWVPRGRLVAAVLCMWELLVQRLHGSLPRLLVGRRPLEGAEHERFAIRTYHVLSAAYAGSRQRTRALWAHLRELNLAERYPPTVERGRAYALHGPRHSAVLRLRGRTDDLSRQGAEMCEQLGDLWGQAQALTWRAEALHSSARHEEAAAVAQTAAQLYERMGDRWGATTPLGVVAEARYRLGDLRGALQLAHDIGRRAREAGSAQGTTRALDLWSRATEGRVPARLVRPELDRAGSSPEAGILAARAEAVRLLGADRPREAEALIRRAVRRVDHELGKHELGASLRCYQVASLRTWAAQLPPTAPAERRRLLRRARAAARAALTSARRFPGELPHALREAAYVAALRDRPRRARALIDESVAAAVELGARYEQALSRHVRGELGLALGWTDADRELADASRQLQALRPPPADDGEAATPLPASAVLSLVDRFESLLEAGRTIATALTPAAVRQALHEAAVALLRPQRCGVLEGGPEQGESLRIVCGDPGHAPGCELVQEVFRTGRPAVAVAGDEATPAKGALVRGGVRAALCAPIFARRRPFGCLYLTHGEAVSLFGEEELRIAGFLASIAGAAFENAEGLARIQALSRELEARVEDRTAELGRTNQQLQRNLVQLEEAQDQLLRAGRMAAVGTLVAGLSHELNSPLGVILGNSEILLKLVPPEDPRRRLAQAIERQAQRAARLVRTLLGFSRAKPQRREEVAPKAIVETVMELVSAEARTRQIDLRVTLSDDLPALMVSVHEIESALVNLASNAVEATPAGGKVVITAERRERGGEPGLIFSVHDTGSGIPDDVLPSIFDPFFTTKAVGEGTGLGLSLARQAVIAHGGEIDVESVSGDGTTMTIWLPVDASPRAPRPDRGAGQATAAGPAANDDAPDGVMEPQ